MAITDINISDTLETSAPSIRYQGNEGPKSPEEQQQMMMAQVEQEYEQYRMEQMEIDPSKVLPFEEWYQSVYAASRQGVAHGGIMGLDGRKRYGIGSWLKKRARKLIPNELATAARVAAPFVAPFNPLIGGAMAGLGGFDKHGSIGRGLKSGLMTYGGGQAARYLGGAGPQWGLQTSGATAGGGLGNYFSKPTGTQTGLGKWLDSRKTVPANIPGTTEGATTSTNFDLGVEDVLSDTQNVVSGTDTGGTLGKISEFIENNSKAILLGSMGIAYATAKPQDMQEAIRVSRGTGLDIDGIRKEVQEALAGGEEAWAELQKKYPYIGEYDTKIGAAEGGRIGLYAGGQSVPSDYTMEDAMMTTTQDKLGGITDVMKQADLSRAGDVGQFYAAQGGRIGFAGGMNEKLAELKKAYNTYIEGGGTLSFEKFSAAFAEENFAQGGRIGAQEGGLMDLGGMEKDYRNDGGFVPIGGEEKADDVPARLSKNEFVFTADAVRGAGGGDIDKGAEIMENIMKNLEQGGQISEETQGLSGAQEMFDVSERLSEVV
jgi:hypothetical protein